MSRQLRRSAACLNCGAEITGNFCATCGQENTDYRISLRRLLGDLIDEVFQLESRLWRTLWTLFRHPGRLTIEYNRGRRVRYTTPLRLYLIASVVYFFVASLTPLPNLKVDLKDVHAEVSSGSSELDQKIGHGIARRIEVVKRDPQAAANRAATALVEWSPRMMVILLPLFALLTFALFRRPRLYFVEHVVFALHLHAAVFFLWTLADLLRDKFGVLLWLGTLTWLCFGARAVFQQSWWRLAWKLPLLALVYFMAAGSGISLIALFGIFNV